MLDTDALYCIKKHGTDILHWHCNVRGTNMLYCTTTHVVLKSCTALPAPSFCVVYHVERCAYCVPVNSASPLHACYAISGTDGAFGTGRRTLP
eukprot:788388-Rhodomonas_salina.6